MAQWQAVSKTRHRNAGWLSYTDHRFAAEDVTCPLLVAELPHAVACFPIAFTLAGESYQLVALQSLQPGVNLYVNSQGQWLAPYVPAWYRSHPLRLLQSQEGEHVLCVDEDSPLFRAKMEGEQRFFNDQGEVTPALQQVIDFLQQCRNNQTVTQTLVNALADAGLIQPWALELDTGKEQPTPVAGIFHINEAALQNLPGERLAPLAQSGALAIAYAQLLSAPRLADFSKRYQHRAQDQARQVSDEINLDALFGEHGETFKFGF
jgi:hypothetical protein